MVARVTPVALSRAGRATRGVLGAAQRPGGGCGNTHTVAAGREMTLPLPAGIALQLILWLKALTLEQAFGQAQRHCGVVTPAAARQIKCSAAQQIAHRCKAPRSPVLGRGAERIAHRESKQAAAITPTQRLQRRQAWGWGERLTMSGPAADEFGLLARLRHHRPSHSARTGLPQPIELAQGRGTVESLLGEVTADHGGGAADAGAAMHVDAPAHGHGGLQVRQNDAHLRQIRRHRSV